jgi:peptide/nickel transport system permease protein
MVMFTLRRIGSSVLLALVVSFATFVLMFGNGPAIARSILDVDATQTQIDAKVVELGLDQPVLLQYMEWLGGLLSGDLGVSYYTGEPVTTTLANRVPVTIALVGIAMLLTAILSALLGIASAVLGGWADRLLQVIALIGGAVPSFIIAIVLIMTLAVGARMFPATGYVPFETNPVAWALSLVLPVAAIVISAVGPASQQFRGAVKDVLEKDFVRTLRARGVRPAAVIFQHVFRNAAGPGIIVLGLQIIVLMGGAVVIERVFSLPGVGELTINSSLQGDIPLVMGSVLFVVVVVVVVNFAADLANAALNPKVRQK